MDAVVASMLGGVCWEQGEVGTNLKHPTQNYHPEEPFEILFECNLKITGTICMQETQAYPKNQWKIILK
jgi:hypothetical protein